MATRTEDLQASQPLTAEDVAPITAVAMVADPYCGVCGGATYEAMLSVPTASVPVVVCGGCGVVHYRRDTR